jgi:hypothetical protein
MDMPEAPATGVPTYKALPNGPVLLVTFNVTPGAIKVFCHELLTEFVYASEEIVPRKFPPVLSTTLLTVAMPVEFPVLPKTTLSAEPGTPAVPVPPDQLAASDQLVEVVLPAVQFALPACVAGAARRAKNKNALTVQVAAIQRAQEVMNMEDGKGREFEFFIDFDTHLSSQRQLQMFTALSRWKNVMA